MEHLSYSQIEKGTLLIASPEIESGLLFRSVVLLCEHTANGSFGIIINKNLPIELPEEIMQVDELSNPNIQIRAGGPVQTNQMMLLHADQSIPEQTMEVTKGVYLGGDLNFLQETMTKEDGSKILLCFGYCGWGSGQLEREFLDGQWYIHPGNAYYVFEASPEKLWQQILRDMGGKYATISMIPEDLSLN
jgi:putative transcriptional regulator